MESVNFHGKRGVVEATDHLVHLFLSFHPYLELLQLLRLVHRLPIIVEDGHSVQWLGEDLVAVIVQPDDDGVWVEYDLHILRLLDLALRTCDGERNEMIPIVRLEPRWDLVSLDLVASLIQGKPRRSGRIWSLVQVVRICERAYEEVRSWVKIPFAHVAGSAAPRSACCQCTCWRSASHAAIFAVCLAMALASCLSLHVEHTFRSAVCDALRLQEGDW